MIRARDLRKAFAKIQAVDGVSLALVADETFGFLGPNGAGKTTTIHMLIGALRPDDGEVTINGSTDPTRADVRREIGVAPQVEALYDEVSAAEHAPLRQRPAFEAHQLRNAGVEFVRFPVDRPSLESVFLNLTGRRLRD